LISSIKWLKHFEWQSKISYRSLYIVVIMV
jgi:hypothetical protein